MDDGPMDMGHVEDLATAYALGALEPAERERVERHRRVCPGCDRLLTGEEQVVGLLPFLVRATPPPSPDVKVALLARVAQNQRAGKAGRPSGRVRVAPPTATFPASRPRTAVFGGVGGTGASRDRRSGWATALLTAPLLLAVAVLATLAVQFHAQAEELGAQTERFGAALDQTLTDGGAVYRLHPGPAAPEARGVVAAGTGRRDGTIYVKADKARAGERYRFLGWVDGNFVGLATVELDGRGRGAAVFTADRPLSAFREFVVRPVGDVRSGLGRVDPALRGVGGGAATPDGQSSQEAAPEVASGRRSRIGDVGGMTAASE